MIPVQKLVAMLILVGLLEVASLELLSSRGRKWPAVHGKRSLHAPSTDSALHLRGAALHSADRQWCSNMARLEELHGQWQASPVPAVKVRILFCFGIVLPCLRGKNTGQSAGDCRECGSI